MMRRYAFLGAACLALAPASAQPAEPVQQSRLASALSGLQPQRPGVVDAYVIVAALDSDPVFGREAREAGRVLASRFDAEGRTIVLAQDEGSDRADAAGTPAHFALAVARAAQMMDRREDVLVVYATSHGSPRAGLDYEHPQFGSGIVTPNQLAAIVSPFENRLIIIQACFSGQFIRPLAAPRTVVATAASALNPSFGCSPGNDWTFFGHALINLSMRQADSFVRQFRRAVVTILGWEKKLGIQPSNPQISIGSQSGPWLQALDASARRVPAAPVGNAPSELGRE